MAHPISWSMMRDQWAPINLQLMTDLAAVSSRSTTDLQDLINLWLMTVRGDLATLMSMIQEGPRALL